MVPGRELVCASGSPADQCSGCLPPGQLTDEEYFYYMSPEGGGCGVEVQMGGMAGETVKYLVIEKSVGFFYSKYPTKWPKRPF